MRVTATGAGACLTVSAAVLALSGCGGSTGTAQGVAPGAGEAGATSPVIVRADAICRRLNAELVANVPKTVSTQKTVSARVIASVSPRNAALEQRAVSELAGLQPPKSSAQEWRQVIYYRHLLAHALTELARVARAGDRASMKLLGQYKQSVRKKLLVAGRHVGFAACQTLG